MNCFNHRDQAAVAVCKACGKGLCPECLAQVGSSIACRDSCENRAAVLDSLIDARLSLPRLMFFLIAAWGLFFLLWGVLSYSADNAATSLFTAPMGAILLSVGIIATIRSRRLSKLK
jgi:hypothetical protein